MVIPLTETIIIFLGVQYASYAMNGRDVDCNAALDTECSIKREYEHSLHVVETPHV